jgi:long-chain acyl-CoA synthetase
MHVDVSAAAVLGVADALRGERLVALVWPRRDTALDRALLIAHARLSLPLYKVPRRYAVPQSWPTTRSGKTDFQTLAQLWADGGYEELT